MAAIPVPRLLLRGNENSMATQGLSFVYCALRLDFRASRFPSARTANGQSKQNMKRRYIRRHIVILGLLVIVFGGLTVFNYILKPMIIQQVLAARVPPPVTISAQVAKAEVWKDELTSVGSLVAVLGTDVSSQVAGKIVEIHFESGTSANKGDILVKIDDSVDRADLENAKAALKLAQLTYNRGKELYGNRNYPKANLDKDKASLDQAAAQVEKINATIALKTIRAPFSGRLGIRQVNLGQYLGVGTAVVSIQSLDPIYVNFSVPGSQAPLLNVGQEVAIKVEGLSSSDYVGKITSLDARVNTNTRNILVQATVANREKRLLPGMFADVRVFLSQEKPVVVVPQTAISYSLYGDSIFVVKKDDKGVGNVVERRYVTVGAKRGDKVAVMKGLKAGEQVVTSGQIKLRPGAPVTINNTVDLTPPKVRPRQ